MALPTPQEIDAAVPAAGTPNRALTNQALKDLVGALSAVATTGAYADLTGKPTLGTVAALSGPGGTTNFLRADNTYAQPPGLAVSWGAVGGTLANQTDLAAALALKANTSSLAAVATSGSYADLSNKPTIVNSYVGTYTGGTAYAQLVAANPAATNIGKHATVNNVDYVSDGTNWVAVGSGLTGTLTTVSNAIAALVKNTATLALGVAGAPISMGVYSQVNNFSTADVNGGGHQVGVFGFSYNDATGTVNAFAIGVEGTVGNNNGTITKAVGVMGTLNQNTAGKTITTFLGLNGVPTNNAGTIGLAVGCRSEVTSGNTGTITEFRGFDIPDLSGSGTIGKRFAFVNADALSDFKSVTPYCDSSYYANGMTTGGTTTVPDHTGFVLLNAGGTISNQTIALPAAPTPGLTINIFTVPAISVLAITSTGNSIFGAPANLPTNGRFTMKFVAGLAAWLCIA